MPVDLPERIEPGDILTCMCSRNFGAIKVGIDYRVNKVDGSIVHIYNDEDKVFGYPTEYFKLKFNKKIINQQESPMNQLIVTSFPSTADAVLVDKYFGKEIANQPLAFLIIKGNEADLLAKAKELDAATTAK